MTRFIILLVFVVNAFSVQPSGNWFRFESKCFLTDSAKVSQPEANNLCRTRGAILAMLSNKELNFIKNSTEPTSYWLAATREDPIGEFRWADGGLFNKSWWGKGQPNDGDDCALLHHTTVGFQMHGTRCKMEHSYLCSKSAGWKMANRDSYRISNLCGVEIMPNCKGLSCEDVCDSHNDCHQFAKMLNVCVNIKIITQTDQCIVRLRPNFELYRKRGC